MTILLLIPIFVNKNITGGKVIIWKKFERSVYHSMNEWMNRRGVVNLLMRLLLLFCSGWRGCRGASGAPGQGGCKQRVEEERGRPNATGQQK